MTMEEYVSQNESILDCFNQQWSAVKFDCPKCGGGMRKDLTVVLTSYPPRYIYQCDKCKHIEHLPY